jgi:serine/threonine-protein kinase RsbW
VSRTVTLTMPAKSEYLILARLALAGIAREVPMSESVLADLKLAVTEACGNAVRHAYPDDPGTVRVRFEVDTSSIAISVEDDGAGAEAVAPAGATLDADGMAESGMGLAIIDAVVDALDVDRPREGTGTLVRMHKRLRTPTDPPGAPQAESADRRDG